MRHLMKSRFSLDVRQKPTWLRMTPEPSLSACVSGHARHLDSPTTWKCEAGQPAWNLALKANRVGSF
jgi:hypothetical protein